MRDPFFYPRWQNACLTYDLKKFNLPQLVLDVIKEKFPMVSAMETLHEIVPPYQISDLCLHVQSAFGREEFQKFFDTFAEEYVSPLLEGQKYLIKRQPTLNCVIPEQTKYARRLPFHQGIFYNNGRGMATMWMPITRAYATNSMYIANLEDSRRLTKQTIEEKLSLEEFEQRCLDICTPVEKSPGEVHLFTQEHIHGNVDNQTGVTRCAVDWHVLVEGGECQGRVPGGFFRLPGDYEQTDQTDYSERTFITYVGNNSRYDKKIPIHMQRKVIDDYCNTKGITNMGIQFENEYLDWLPILEHYIQQQVDGIVMLSMHSLPSDKTRAEYLMKLAVRNNVEIHFANEFCSLRNVHDLKKIKQYLHFSPMESYLD